MPISVAASSLDGADKAAGSPAGRVSISEDAGEAVSPPVTSAVKSREAFLSAPTTPAEVASRHRCGRDPLSAEARALIAPPSGGWAEREQIWPWLHGRECLVGQGDRERARRRLSIVAHALIPPDRLAIEAGLTMSKWFDYRFLHPATLTGVFATYYEIAYRRAYKTYRDIETAEFKDPLATVKDFFLAPVVHVSSPEMRRLISALWRARQFADTAGVPYDFFLSRAFDWFDRKGWKQEHLPRPNQLCRKEVVMPIARQWQERCGGIRVAGHATDPRFRNEFYSGEPIQDDYRGWLLRLYDGGLHSSTVISDLCLRRQLLPIEFFERIFSGSEAVAEAKAAGWRPDPMPEGALSDTRPGCHGVPNAFQEGSEPCRRCRHQATCIAGAREVTSTIEVALGDPDPLRRRKREQARERQRRRRARLKVMAGKAG